MSYEATIKIGRAATFNVEAEPDGVWLFNHIQGGHITTFMTTAEARELAAALLDAAADVEPIDLTAQPVPFTNEVTLQGNVVHAPHRQETTA